MSPPDGASWSIEPSEAGLRVDVLIASRLEDVSRALVRKWIDAGRVRIDGQPVRASRLCREGERVEVDIPPLAPATPEPEEIPLTVLYEDEHLVVIDKPAGMVVHPSPGHPSGTLVNALLFRCHDLSGIGGVERPGIVHRLDGGTTGVIVIAKNDRAHQKLSAQFHDRLVDKRYLAVVFGETPERFVVDSAIGRDPHDRTKISSRSRNAKPASSEFVRLESFGTSSFLEIRIHTGRTHQIRVHSSEAGFPVVGDRDYGAPRKPGTGTSGAEFRPLKAFARPALHAETLSLDHPVTGERMTWKATLPEDMRTLLEELRLIRESPKP